MAHSMPIRIVFMKTSQRLKRPSPERTGTLKTVWRGRRNLCRATLGQNIHGMLPQVHRCLRSKSTGASTAAPLLTWQVAGKRRDRVLMAL